MITGEMDHFDFIKDIEEISSDEKRNINHLIQQSIKKPNGGTGDYFIMDRAQSNLQLQLITEKLIPEKYVERMNEAIKNYQEEGYNFQVQIYEAAQASMDKLGAKFPSLGKVSILTGGIKTLQEQEKMMCDLYSGLNLSRQSNFAQSFEDVLNRYQDELRSKWNDFASLLNDSTVYKLPTTEKPLIDISL